MSEPTDSITNQPQLPKPDTAAPSRDLPRDGPPAVRDLSVRVPEQGLSSAGVLSLFLGGMFLMILPLGFLLLFGEPIRREKSDDGRAKSKVLLLTAAVDAYSLQRGKFPPSLEALLQGDEDGAPLLTDPEDLLDPWGQPFQYDPAGPNNGGRRPDVWTDGPRGRIGNWPGGR
jgi:hypothetical protein